MEMAALTYVALAAIAARSISAAMQRERSCLHIFSRTSFHFFISIAFFSKENKR